MLPTGDVQGCLRKLESLLRVVKYTGHVDYSGLSKGDPSAFLPIVSFTLSSFSPPFAEQLVAAGLELTGKTDLRFTDTVYKVLRDIFNYKPILSKQQFLQWGFSERKISVLCDIINLVVQRHNQMKKPRIRYSASHKDSRGEAYPSLTDPDTVSDGSLFASPKESSSISPQSFHNKLISPCNVSNASHNEIHTSNSVANGNLQLEGEEEDKEDVLHSGLEERLSAIESQLGSLQFGQERLSTLEKRVTELERERNIDKVNTTVLNGDQVTISREMWENLISRVLLLETKLELSNTQLSVPLPCQSSTSSYSSSSMSDDSAGDMKNRLERINNMLKSTSTLLLDTESSLKINCDK